VLFVELVKNLLVQAGDTAVGIETKKKKIFHQLGALSNWAHNFNPTAFARLNELEGGSVDLKSL
jgi:hypothetical protein